MASNASSSTPTPTSSMESLSTSAPVASVSETLPVPESTESTTVQVDRPETATPINVPTDADAPERRPQAGPLPRKRGEIGFRESFLAHSEETTDNIQMSSLPARHPADTDPQSNPLGTTSTSNPPAVNASSTSLPSSDTSSIRNSRRAKLLSLLNPTPRLSKTKVGGVSLTTILRLLFQLTLLGGTMAAWIIITKRLGESGNSALVTSADNPPTLNGSSSIFVHVTFGIAVLGQLLFLERCIYLIRAQRYAHVHPGTVLPMHGQSRGPMPGMGFAPWNRPPLPTYATALAQSGVGTGDVEDSAIAIPPPPAYGNTRGSTLLLRGFLRNSLRATISRESVDSGEAGHHQRPVSQLSTSSRPERPVSYRSQDEEWEERQNAERAMRLAETLGRLEEPSDSSSSSSGISRTIS